MSHEETLRELISILNPQNEARPTALLGAGASFSSGVPLADESVKRIARRYYAERISGKVLPEQVKTSEWLAWLAPFRDRRGNWEDRGRIHHWVHL